VTVQAAHGLTPDEVEALVTESIENAEADFTARRLIELRNKAEGDLRHADKALGSAGTKLTPEERAAIDTAAAGLRAAVGGADLAALQHAIDAFAAATNPLATLVMNEVVKQALGGEKPDDLNPNKL
jgi:molecular chaperone DnaK (HSP70)